MITAHTAHGILEIYGLKGRHNVIARCKKHGTENIDWWYSGKTFIASKPLYEKLWGKIEPEANICPYCKSKINT